MKLRKATLSAVAAMAVTIGVPSPAASTGYRLHATVPLVCFVRKVAGSTQADRGNALGQFQEYCNSPNGYEVRVTYEPGSMVGAELTSGEQRLVLDGSGSAVFERSNGAGARFREIFISARGELNGRQVSFNIVPL